MSESSCERQGTSADTATTGASNAPQKFWEFADLGFDTGKKLWFIQFYNETNENVGTYFARSLILTGGKAAQYQWKDAEGGPFWHVRERFFATEIENFVIDPTGSSITLGFRKEGGRGDDEAIPSEFSYLLYAFHLSSKHGGRAPMGFVEFYRLDGDLIRRIENRWIVIEGLDRRTFGEFPEIRLKVERKDIGRITLTETTIVLEGEQTESVASSDR